MKIRLTFLVGVVLLAAGTGWSQDRLGEVAGSIKLNPEAIVEKEGFIENRQAAEKEDHELFATALTECSASADALGDLIEEARGTIIYLEDNGLTNRLSATALDLDTRLAEFDLMRLSDGFNGSVGTARGAVVFCKAGTDGVREELARRGVAFTRARAEISSCRQELDRAEAQLAAVGATPEDAVVDTATPSASNTDDANVAAVCESQRGNGQEAVDACEERQYQALAALESRTSENELLAAAVFDGIREICIELNPSNFDERNLCEVERMTATRLESE